MARINFLFLKGTKFVFTLFMGLLQRIDFHPYNFVRYNGLRTSLNVELRDSKLISQGSNPVSGVFAHSNTIEKYELVLYDLVALARQTPASFLMIQTVFYMLSWTNEDA